MMQSSLLWLHFGAEKSSFPWKVDGRASENLEKSKFFTSEHMSTAENLSGVSTNDGDWFAKKQKKIRDQITSHTV